MRIGWGTKLTIVFTLFASLISYMVYRCAITPVNLVTSEYYKDELVYQEVIDGTKNADELSSAATLQKSGDEVLLQLPAEMKQQEVTGTVFFYCASNAGNDKTIALQTGDATQTIPSKQLVPGYYTVKIDWQAGKRHYHHEQAFKI